jgi:hypothetical protein
MPFNVHAVMLAAGLIAAPLVTRVGDLADQDLHQRRIRDLKAGL